MEKAAVDIASSTTIATTKSGSKQTEALAQQLWQEIVNDFDPSRGDQKIIRAVARTAAVNLVVATTVVCGGVVTGVVGYVTGGAISAKRVGDGLQNHDPKEVAKGIAVYGSATTASVAGQLVAGAIMVGVVGASLPVAAAVSFGVGCTSGITAGALSEWGVDSAWSQTKMSGIIDPQEGEEEDKAEDQKSAEGESEDTSPKLLYDDGSTQAGKKRRNHYKFLQLFLGGSN